MQDNESITQKQSIDLNLDEFVDQKWLTVKEALDLYMNEELPLYIPQVVLLTRLLFLNLDYNSLK